jgi:hypothetical protein
MMSDRGETKCGDVANRTLVSFAGALTHTVERQTCGTYVLHLLNIFVFRQSA